MTTFYQKTSSAVSILKRIVQLVDFQLFTRKIFTILSLMTLLLVGGESWGQIECGTPSHNLQAKKNYLNIIKAIENSRKNLRVSANNTTIWIGLKFWVELKNNNPLTDLNTINNWLYILNRDYKPLDIQFFLERSPTNFTISQPIPDPKQPYENYRTYMRNFATSVGISTTAINIIVLDYYPYNGAVPSFENFINYSEANNNNKSIFTQSLFSENIDNIILLHYAPQAASLSHEMGHYFCLYHTHQDNGSDCIGLTGVELINCLAKYTNAGSNHTYEAIDGDATGGDAIKDTPADIYKYETDFIDSQLEQSCNVNFSLLDNNKYDLFGRKLNLFHPLVNNLMSYYKTQNVDCRREFTQDQIVRIGLGMNLRTGFSAYNIFSTPQNQNTPTNLTATRQQNNIYLRWNDNSNIETGYLVERSLSPNLDYICIGGVGPNITTFIDQNLPINIPYYYRIRASNSTEYITTYSSSGPVACYPFNGNANDESGNGNHGTVNGATLTTDRFGNTNSAYYFDGNDNITAADNNLPIGSSPRTFSAWVFNTVQQRNIHAGTPGTVMAYGTPSSVTNHCNIVMWGNTIRFSNWSSPPDMDFSYTHPLNQWIHLVVTLDETNTAKIYINGVLQYTSSVETWNTIKNGYFSMGDGFMNAKLDDICIYSRALSEEEILQLYQAQDPVVPTLVATVSNNGSFCTGETIQLSATGGNSFSWSGPNNFTASSSNPTVTGATTLAAGTYTVTATYGVYTSTATVSVTVNPLPTASNNSPICSGNTLSLSATGGSSYTWNGPNNFSSSIAGPSVEGASALLSGTYSVTVTNGSCTATATTTVVVNALPSAMASSNSPICSGGMLNLSATGGNAYTWSGPNFSASTATPTLNNATSSAAGAYTVTVSNGTCTSTASTSVVVNALPSATASSNSPICSGSTLNLSASGGSAYTWSGPNFSASTATPTLNNATSSAVGNYTVTVSNGTCTSTASTSVVVNTLPSATASSNSPICAGKSLALSATGGNAYTWSGPNNFSASIATPAIENASAFATGIYSVTTSDGTCIATATTSVIVNASPSVVANSNSPICSGSTLNLSATGGNAYTWSGPNFSASTATPTLNNSTSSATGIYTVTVSNGSCTSTASTSVLVNVLPSATASSNSPICIGGALNLSAAGGTSYTWNGPNNFSATIATPSIMEVSSLASGIYSVKVMSGTCMNTATMSVFVNDKPIVNLNPSNTLTCVNVNIKLTATTGLGSYSWSNKGGAFISTTNYITFSSPSSGVLRFTVTAGNGTCTNTATTSIQVNESFNVNLKFDPICTLGNPLSLTAGGGDIYAWKGPNGFKSNNATPSKAKTAKADIGIYSVTVTGNTVCTVTSTIRVYTGVGNITLNSNSPVCKGGTINLMAAAEFGTSYKWTKLAGTIAYTGQSLLIPNAKTSDGGIYTVFITGQNECIDKKSISVIVSPIACGGGRLAGTDSEEIEIEINAYPNPTSKLLVVEVILKKASSLRLQLFNTLGKMVSSLELLEETTRHHKEIDLSAYNDGMYLLQAETQQKQKVTKIIKVQ